MTELGGQRPVRRPVVVTAILLIAAAVSLVVLRPWFAGQPDVVDDGASLVPEPETTLDEQAVEAPAAAEAQVATGDIPAARAAPSEPVRVVVLPARIGDPDPNAAVVVDTVRQAMLRALRASAAAVIIDVSAAELAGVVPLNAGSFSEHNLAFLAVSRRYGAGVVAEISQRSGPDSPYLAVDLDVRQANASRIVRNSALCRNGETRFCNAPRWDFGGSDPQSLGVRFAETILQSLESAALSNATPQESDAAPPEAPALLDASRPEWERLRSLVELGNPGGQILDSETLAAAVDLATRSPSADTRRMAWQVLRRLAFDPALAPSLSAALLSDPDAAVRREVALALGAYRGDSSYQEVLASAMRNDSSVEVRIAAQMALMDRARQESFARDSLLDRDLTPAERLGPTVMLGREPGRTPNFPRTLGDAEMANAHAFAEVVSLTDDPALKVAGLAQLMRTFNGSAMRSGQRPDPEITRVMIQSTKDENYEVRRQALTALLSLSDDPEVRAALEAAVENEPELAARLRIPEALSP
jgi:hypothetical protein